MKWMKMYFRPDRITATYLMNRLLILSIALLAISCGVQRHAHAMTQPVRVEINQQPEVAIEVKQEYTLLKEAPAKPVAAIDMNFQTLERQHVSSNYTNPIPDGGIVLDLGSLRGEFTYPLDGRFISDYGMRNGRRHTGIDIKAAKGDTIRAAFPGVVRMSRLYSSYGNVVVVRHYNGLETVYSHNTKNLVAPDDVVLSGQAIALAGRTGRATTEHLHFEIRAGGQPFDPKLVVDPKEMALRDGWLYVEEKSGRVTASVSADSLVVAMSVAEATQAAHDAAKSEALDQSEAKVAEAPKEAVKPVYYTVKRGDVLGAIARKHGTTVSKLCSLNSLKSPDRIREGQRLRVK